VRRHVDTFFVYVRIALIGPAVVGLVYFLAWLLDVPPEVL